MAKKEGCQDVKTTRQCQQAVFWMVNQLRHELPILMLPNNRSAAVVLGGRGGTEAHMITATLAGSRMSKRIPRTTVSGHSRLTGIIRGFGNLCRSIRSDTLRVQAKRTSTKIGSALSGDQSPQLCGPRPGKEQVLSAERTKLYSKRQSTAYAITIVLNIVANYPELVLIYP
jgi:hypothetical protein